MEAVHCGDKRSKELSTKRKMAEVGVISFHFHFFPDLEMLKRCAQGQAVTGPGSLGLCLLVALCKDRLLLHAFRRSCLLPLKAEVRGKNLVSILPCTATRTVSEVGDFLGPGLSLL